MFRGMTARLIALTLAVAAAAGGCVTTTTHRLVLADNPHRAEAIACEKECRWFRAPDRGPCEITFASETCGHPGGSEDQYAACLDTCPGAATRESASCPDQPTPDDICLETSGVNAAALAGGGVAAGIVVTIAAILASGPWLLIILLAG